MSDYTDSDWPGEPGPEMTLTYLNIKAQSVKAWLIEFDLDNDLNSISAWLPKSICNIDEDEKTIDVPEWLVYEKDLESYEL